MARLQQIVQEASPQLGVAPVCRALGISRATLYRHHPAASPACNEQDRLGDTLIQAAFSSGGFSLTSSVQALSESAPDTNAAHDTTPAPDTNAAHDTTPAPDIPTAARESKCRVPGRALSAQERQEVLSILHSEAFMDLSVPQVYTTLLDQGLYHCSISAMYRLLRETGEVHERRNQLVHPSYQKPELLASQPNQLWSWDITKLKGPVKYSYYYLYVILDVFSRYATGWMLADCESAELARELISETCHKQNIPKDQLTIHADRGSSMTSKPVALLLADLGVIRTHSRPHTSNDNPYSESQFKTMKYRPTFPERFEGFEEARSFCREFFDWYNKEHHHSGIAMLTPEVVHFGQATQVLEQRQQVLSAAYAQHPERFVRKAPHHPALPKNVWINKPENPSADPAITDRKSVK